MNSSASEMNSKALEIQLSIRSESPRMETPVLANELVRLGPELAGYLKDRYDQGEVHIEISRIGTLPIDPHAFLMLIKVTGEIVAKGALAGVGTKIGAEVYDWVRNRFKEAKVSKLPGSN